MDPSLSISKFCSLASLVPVDFYVDNKDDIAKDSHKIQGLVREHLQRQAILKVWKENGMTTQDIGFISDVDEVFTRDFLLAAQTCDIPQFRPGQDCRAPKLMADTLVFESSPECVTDLEKRSWFHPDTIIGECIETIGDSETVHTMIATRDYKDTQGCRSEHHGKQLIDYDLYPLNQTSISMYPLWNPADFQCVEGGTQLSEKYLAMRYDDEEGDKKLILTHTGYHFHNFFETIELLRNKYLTYCHPIKEAESKPLGELQTDINMAIACVMNRSVDDFRNPPLKGGFEAIPGQRPLMLEYDEYRAARHEELYRMIVSDELKNGVYVQEKKNDE